MELALLNEIWKLLRHEEIPGIHVLATILTGNAWLFNEKQKDLSNIRYQHVISEF